MNFEKLLSRIALLFRETEIPYMLVGGFAVAYWGYPRQSLDIDVVVDLTGENLGLFLKHAKKHGFIFHASEIKTVLQKGNRFVIERDDFRIDCWLPRSWFERQALETRKRKKLFGVNLFIICPEDLILSKLLIGRARDLEDIKTILLRQGKKIDKSYLRRQAMALNVAESLTRVFKG